MYLVKQHQPARRQLNTLLADLRSAEIRTWLHNITLQRYLVLISSNIAIKVSEETTEHMFRTCVAVSPFSVYHLMAFLMTKETLILMTHCKLTKRK